MGAYQGSSDPRARRPSATRVSQRRGLSESSTHSRHAAHRIVLRPRGLPPSPQLGQGPDDGDQARRVTRLREQLARRRGRGSLWGRREG